MFMPFKVGALSLAADTLLVAAKVKGYPVYSRWLAPLGQGANFVTLRAVSSPSSPCLCLPSQAFPSASVHWVLCAGCSGSVRLAWPSWCFQGRRRRQEIQKLTCVGITSGECLEGQGLGDTGLRESTMGITFKCGCGR